MTRLLALSLLLALLPAAVWAQDQLGDPHSRRGNPQQLGGQLLETFRGLGDWRDHYGYMMDAVDSIYDANQWNSEPDQFSRELIHTVEALPPWDFQGRLDTMVGMFSDRYLLDEDQEEKLRDVFMQQMAGIIRDHGPRIMEYAGEIVRTRAAGEPFTPELVQRWTQMSQPVYEDMKKRMNKMAGQFMQEVGPQQRALIEADLGAANNRLKRVDELNEHWRQGRWSPADWGMHTDPIQLAGEARRAAADPGATGPSAAKPGAQNGDRRPDAEAPGAAPGSDASTAEHAEPVATPAGSAAPAGPSARPKPAAGPAPSGENDAWSQFVREFIRRYQLDEDQAQRAWIIYRDVRARAAELGVKVAAAPDSERGSAKPGPDAPSAAGTSAGANVGGEHAGSGASQRLFDQMKRRLERLPTRAQRRAAAAPAEPKVSPAESPAKR